MAEPEVVIATDENGEDVEMENSDGVAETGGATGLEEIETEVPQPATFIDYLRSPIVELVVGDGEEQTILYAHEKLLVQCPYFEKKLAELNGHRRVELIQHDLVAAACFLEYLYKQDYYPAMTTSHALEHDPNISLPDDTGVALLKHARVYTLAQEFGVPALASLAHKKIHLTESTAKGEIHYARYIYAHTVTDDQKVRKPVAQFWATRSHVLRHEAEREFRQMCLDFPQFGFDVLNLVLDAQEKRTAKSEASSQVGRKRARVSQA